LDEYAWTYNDPELEEWNHESYETKKEAEEKAIEYAKEEGLEVISIGRCESVPLENSIDVDDLLERLNEQYGYNAGGEYDRDLYDGVTDEDKEWLEDELQKVINKFHERAKIVPNWFNVTDIYEVVVK
jgi:hypothetical protein